MLEYVLKKEEIIMNNNEYLFEEINMLLDTINKLKFNKVKISDEEKLLLSMQLFKCCLLRSGVTNDGPLYILTRLFASVPFDSDKRIKLDGKNLRISNEDNSSFLNFNFGSDKFKEAFVTYKQLHEKEIDLNILQRALDGFTKIVIRNNNDIETNMYLDDFGIEMSEQSIMRPSFSQTPYVKLYRKYSRLEDDLTDCWSRGLYTCAISNVVIVHGKEVSSEKRYDYLGENTNDLIVFPTIEENVKSNNNYDELFYKMLYSNSQNLKKYFPSILNAFDEHKQDKIRKL